MVAASYPSQTGGQSPADDVLSRMVSMAIRASSSVGLRNKKLARHCAGLTTSAFFWVINYPKVLNTLSPDIEMAVLQK